ncbi:MAG: Histidine triad (HIT) protein [uncultured bacterium]|nr:MAG: Histidine triad (HIT) protein [uncultured bacterium]
MKCPFCEIPEIRKRKIIENELASAFLTNIPITIGHGLVVPKRCVPRFEDLSAQEIKAILDLGEMIKKALAKAYGAEGFNVAYNENEAAGQSVHHFHLHIVPRKENDSGIYQYDPRKFIYRPGNREVSEESELGAVASEIRKYV